MFDEFFNLAFCWMDVISLSSDLTSYTIFTYIFLWVVVVWLFLFLQHIFNIFR
jgi:hypothetical protein